MPTPLQTQRTFSELLPTSDPTYRNQQRTFIETLFRDFTTKRKNNTDYLNDPATLKEALDDYETLQGGYGPGGKDFGIIGAESYYFRLQKTLHSDDETFLSGANKADEFATKMQNELLFFEHTLSTISPEKQAAFLASPLLSDYHHFLEKRFAEAHHLLTPEGEKILNILSKTSYENRAALTEKLLSQRVVSAPGKKTTENLPTESTVPTELPFETLIQRCSDLDEEKRTRAAEQINTLLTPLADVAENELNSILEYKKETDTLRNFSYPEEETYLRDDIDKEVVDAMATAVVQSFSFSQQFYTFKAQLLGKSQLTYAEKNIKYGHVDKTYTFDEAVDLVYETVQALDPEFGTLFKELLQQGKIDVFPHKGKRGGAFCSDTSKALPVYIMLNFTGKIRDVSILIHELGHGINALLQRKQNSLNYGAVVSTAEVASTFFESVLMRKLSSNLTGEELLAFRMSVLDDMVSTVQRQIACFRFEQSLHEAFRTEGYLSAQKIGQLFLSAMKDYMGGAILFSPGTENRRMYRSHIRYFFYVYSYASGFLIAKSMEAMLHHGKISITQLKDFLSSGKNSSPKAIFQQMGIDITKADFRQAGLQEMQTYLDETIQLAEELRKK